MKRLLSVLLGISILTLCITCGPQPPRGKALYDLLGSRTNLTMLEGTRSVTWLPNGMGYLESETDTTTKTTIYYKVDPQTGNKSDLFDVKTLESLRKALTSVGLTVPADPKSKALPFGQFTYTDNASVIQFSMPSDRAAVYRYSIKTGTIQKAIRPGSTQPGTAGQARRMQGGQSSRGTQPPQRGQQLQGGLQMRGGQQLQGSFSPDYTKFAYVENYDIKVKDLTTGAEKQVTTGGKEELMNGQTDWVYPEELGQSTAYWWSPNGKMIAYLQFDEGEVYQYPLVHEVSTFEARLELERYPNAGEPNPTVNLYIVNVKTGKTVKIDTKSSKDVYIVKPTWLNNSSELLFQRLNRWQNHLELLAANPATGKVRTILDEKEDCFINLHNNYRELSDGVHFLWSSERTGWRHLYLYDYKGTLVKQLTDGEWEVSGINLIDEANKYLYFTANTNEGLESQFFRVKFDGTELRQLTQEAGVHSVSIDPAGKYYLDSFSSLTVPTTVNLYSSDGKLIKNMAKTNIAPLDSLKLEPPELVKFTAADGQTILHSILYKPAGYSKTKKYPLIVSVYGGPSGGVRNSFQTTGQLQQWAQLGFMMVKQDNRGTTNRGKKYLTMTYLKFGDVEIADQAAGVKQLAQRSYIDGSRVGIYGGSYGGYSTVMALLKYPDVFQVGAASSSVTDWHNYDSIYTERYMRLPGDNPEGYKNGSALNFVDNLKGKLLVVHGTIDNNVHPSNTIHLIDALQKAGKTFDFMFYPEQRHGISSSHLTKLRLDYLINNLKPEPVK
jgi:dipeptidyl-peptidase-4